MNTIDLLPINNTEIAQEKLDIDEKNRSNLFQWNGQFSPQFIEALLAQYAKPTFHVLDPFMGSGTVLYECARFGLQASGADVNPAALKISTVYELCLIAKEERKTILHSLEELLKAFLPLLLPLFSSNHHVSRSYADTLTELLALAKKFPVKHPERIVLDAFVVLIDTKKCHDSASAIPDTWRKFAEILLSLPSTHHQIRGFNSDCRQLPLDDNVVDLVITSPPYINVFNYHQQYRKNTERLGWDILEVAKSEIGSNRNIGVIVFLLRFNTA
ncbi:MAG: hypothetical protein GKR94_10390 [Gammaproteobacteria bacterium]|nr:hypothetical protein [Gammaproteobacteria bacterium]